jgi:Flp pilus assembly protein TadB
MGAQLVKCDFHNNREATEVCFLCKKHICAECTCQIVDKQGNHFQLCQQCNESVKARLQKRKQAEETKLTYFIPAILILAGFAFLISSFTPASVASPLIIVGVLIIVAGLPAYFLLNKARKKGR